MKGSACEIFLPSLDRNTGRKLDVFTAIQNTVFTADTHLGVLRGYPCHSLLVFWWLNIVWRPGGGLLRFLPVEDLCWPPPLPDVAKNYKTDICAAWTLQRRDNSGSPVAWLRLWRPAGRFSGGLCRRLCLQMFFSIFFSRSPSGDDAQLHAERHFELAALWGINLEVLSGSTNRFYWLLSRDVTTVWLHTASHEGKRLTSSLRVTISESHSMIPR